jgi:hypothetical protein
LKIKLFFLLLILNSTVGLAQADSLTLHNIEVKAYLIDNNFGKRTSKHKFKIDSLKVKSKLYENKIYAEIKLDKKPNLTAEFYYENDKIILIKFTERSSHLKKYKTAKKLIEFYYANNELVEERTRKYFPGSLTGMGVPKDTDKAFGYNKDWTFELLSKLADKILININE